MATYPLSSCGDVEAGEGAAGAGAAAKAEPQAAAEGRAVDAASDRVCRISRGTHANTSTPYLWYRSHFGQHREIFLYGKPISNLNLPYL